MAIPAPGDVPTRAHPVERTDPEGLDAPSVPGRIARAGLPVDPDARILANAPHHAGRTARTSADPRQIPGTRRGECLPRR